MKPILITGGSSFIGRNLIEHLQTKYRLSYPSSHELDLLSPKSAAYYFRRSPEFDAIIHAALYIGPEDKTKFASDMLGKNLFMLFNILKYKKRNCRFIFLGSGAEYDKSRPLVKVRETEFGKSIPADDYGLFKYTASRIIENTPNGVNLRLFGVYGKYEDYQRRPVSEFIVRSILGLPIIVKRNFRMDYIYAPDLARIVEYLLHTTPKYVSYNIGRGKGITLTQLAEKVKEVTSSTSAIRLPENTSENEYTCDISRLRAEIGDLRFTDFDASLLELHRWYLLKKDTLEILS